MSNSNCSWVTNEAMKAYGLFTLKELKEFAQLAEVSDQGKKTDILVRLIEGMNIGSELLRKTYDDLKSGAIQISSAPQSSSNQYNFVRSERNAMGSFLRNINTSIEKLTYLFGPHTYIDTKTRYNWDVEEVDTGILLSIYDYGSDRGEDGNFHIGGNNDLAAWRLDKFIQKSTIPSGWRMPAVSPSGSSPPFTVGSVGLNRLAMEGKKVYVTGKVPGCTKNTLMDMITNAGLVWAGGMRKSMDLLVIGENPGSSKLSQAREWGIPTMGYKKFLQMIGVSCG